MIMVGTTTKVIRTRSLYFSKNYHHH